jgi:DNA polymerase-3 subunit alpha
VLPDIIDAVGRDNFMFEVMPHDMDSQRVHNMMIQRLARKHDAKIIATNDCHYVNPSDRILQEVLLAVQTKKKWDDPKRMRFDVGGLYLRSSAKMREAFEEQGCFNGAEAAHYMANAGEFADSFDFRIEKIPIAFPLPDLYTGEDEDKLLHRLATAGFKKRFGSKDACKGVYKRRFEIEFDLIKQKKFSRYFILVNDLLRWCDEQQISYGPRGSVGGSLIAYLLGITLIDPLKHDLLFSRFIAPDRVDFPDIDIDFEDVRREEVRRYLITTYGSDRVAGVSTFLRAKARYIVRDVSRTFDVPKESVDEFCKAIDRYKYADLEDKEEIEEAAASPEGRRFAKQYPEVLDYASRLVGQVRSLGQHAAAIVVASEDLREGRQCNLALRGGTATGTVVVNWDMQEIENFGLLKLDVLGLNTLTILNNARKQIEKREGKRIEFADIDL